MNVENISWSNLHERMLPTRQGWNPQPPDHQSNVHPTEPPKPACIWSTLFAQVPRICPAFANCVDPDQLASEEANWSGPTLFVIKYVTLFQQPGSSIIWLAEIYLAWHGLTLIIGQTSLSKQCGIWSVYINFLVTHSAIFRQTNGYNQMVGECRKELRHLNILGKYGTYVFKIQINFSPEQ